MKVFNSYGSKERLFEMMERVNRIDLVENNQEILDFLKTIRSDYPNDNETYTKFLNLAKKMVFNLQSKSMIIFIVHLP